MAAPVIVWLFAFVWLFWIRGDVFVFLLLGVIPNADETGMDRNWYYIGIAFFGMINGMFNPLSVFA